ncbi:hypothetical protein [Pedococcus sp. 5OH_020]|uniref:hypothetical protein n=1 Tax=Pedococcus sp. 5OH_020 TaxID=2989814 RepID=UPI0022E9A519|nr:hypothetical protein [Pedococcus sp. 5OH_020]
MFFIGVIMLWAFLYAASLGHWALGIFAIAGNLGFLFLMTPRGHRMRSPAQGVSARLLASAVAMAATFAIVRWMWDDNSIGANVMGVILCVGTWYAGLIVFGTISGEGKP